MEPTTLRTTRDRTIELSPDELRDFADGLQGVLARPGDALYEEGRTPWYAMIDRRPGLVVHCAGPADVQRAVGLAGRHDLLVSVRSGGHNIAGSALCDGGLTLDLSGMTGLLVDPAARTARAEPGLDWGALDRETQRYGLATPAVPAPTRTGPSARSPSSWASCRT